MRAPLLVAGALTLAVLTGCGPAEDAPSAAPDQSLGAAPSAAPVPATSAGPLTKDQLPAASTLGKEWKAYAEPGGGESAVIGNGSSAQQRDVAEVMEGLTPIGCPESAVDIALPRPDHALEGTYRGPQDRPGVSLVLQFQDAATAAGFLAKFGDQIDACPAPANPLDDDPLSLGFTRVSAPDGLAAMRSEYGIDADPNRYLVIGVHRSSRIGLLYVSGAKGATADRLATGLAASITR